MELVVNASNSITLTLPMAMIICLNWEINKISGWWLLLLCFILFYFFMSLFVCSKYILVSLVSFTLPMICLIWESKASDQRKTASFFFLLSLYVCDISIYASNFHLTYAFFFCFCFFVFGCEPMICLNCERKRGYHCQGKYDVFLFCPYFERERIPLILDSVYCIDIFGCIYGQMLYRWDWDYARL